MQATWHRATDIRRAARVSDRLSQIAARAGKSVETMILEAVEERFGYASAYDPKLPEVDYSGWVERFRVWYENQTHATNLAEECSNAGRGD